MVRWRLWTPIYSVWKQRNAVRCVVDGDAWKVRAERKYAGGIYRFW